MLKMQEIRITVEVNRMLTIVTDVSLFSCNIYEVVYKKIQET